jgi:hypothetical protein
MVERQLPKLIVRVRFSSPALNVKAQARDGIPPGRGSRSLIGTACLVLVDHARALAVVSHPGHEVPAGAPLAAANVLPVCRRSLSRAAGSASITSTTQPVSLVDPHDVEDADQLGVLIYVEPQ